jgi:hypothetical protein
VPPGWALPTNKNNRVLLLIAALSAVTFWIVEAFWKTSQQCYYPRIYQIEAHFSAAESREASSTTTPFGIATEWSRSFAYHGGNWRAWRIMTWPHVMLPHAVIVMAGFVLFLFYPPANASSEAVPETDAAPMVTNATTP